MTSKRSPVNGDGAMSRDAEPYRNEERRRERRKLRAKPLLRKIAPKLGLAIYHYRNDFHYCPGTYGAGYWKKIDIREIEGFRELAKKVIADKRTLLHYDRLYMLYQAIWNVRHLADEHVGMAEVGVYRGGGSYFIAAVADALFQVRPKICVFDTFEGHPDDISDDDDSHWPGKFGDTSFAEVKEYLSVFPNVVVHRGRFQDRCSEIAAEQFCFVHVDVDIYSATRDCLDFFSDRLLIGGVMIVDDYGFTTCEGSKQAVDNFIAQRRNFMKFYLETGQSLLVRTGQ
jgi:O-methyltransferase